MMMTDKIELTYIPDSKVIKIYIEAKDGQDETVEAWFNSFWNHGATKGELEKIVEGTGAFLTTRKKFMRALVDIHLFILLNEMEGHGEAGLEACKGLKGGVMPRAKEIAQAVFDGMEKRDSSMRYGRIGYVYTLGEIYTNDEKAFTSGRNAGE